MAVEKILTHKNGVAEYIITSKEDLKELVDIEVGSRARLLNPIEVRDYIYCGKWVEVKREDSYGDNEIEGIIDDINSEIMDNAVETVNEYHKNLDSLVDCTVTEFEGRDIMINPSIEGKTKNVVVKGETYQNLVSNKESSYTLTQGTITDRSKLICETSLIKPNTLYTVIFEVTDINLAGTDEISICVQYSYCSITSKTLASVKNKGIYMGTFTTGNIVEDSNRKFRIKGLLEQWENDTTTTEKTITFKNVVVLEGDYTNSYVPPYFEGIVGVGDKSKNLFNPKEAILGYVDSTGGFVEVVNNIRTNYLLIKPNTPYIGMSQGASKLNSYSWFDKNKTFIKRDSMEGYAISPNNAMYLIYHNQYCAIGFTVDLSSVKIQLEEGTVSTPYEPYYDGHKTEILSRGKNLFKAIKSGRQIHNTSEVNIINSNSVEIVSASNTWASECFILNCKPNTKYYFSCNAKKVSNEGGIYVRVYDKKTHTVIKELVNRGAFEKDTYFNKSFTTPSDLTNCYVGVQLYCSKEGGSDTNGGKWIYDNIILEEENSTSYIPYQEDKIQILLDEPLMKLPNGVYDTLEQRDDGVYLVKRVGKVVLNGSENWSLTNTMTTNKVYSYYNEDVKRGTANITSIICDNLPSTNRNNIINNDVTGIASRSSNKGFMISIPITEASNSANFKTWLSSNNLTVYYELATPIETKLDISTTNVTTFKDVTHISTTNEIQPIINVTLETTNISKDANQYFSIENNKNFILPNMDDIENNSIKELNLYMDIKGEYALTFPSDIKWSSNVINLNKVDYMSILLKYIKVNDVGLWLGNIRGIDKEG